MKDKTQQYWLDSEIEAKKQFDLKSWEIEKQNPKYREIVACANELLPNKNIETVLSLACGSCWLESELFEHRSSMCVLDNWKQKRSNTKGFLLAPDLVL